MRNVLLILVAPVRAVYRGLVWIANSPRALMGGYVGLLIVSSTLYTFIEDKPFGDSLWWAVVTASTVGYGDTYPSTAAGRFVGAILIIVMVMLVIPLITAHFASKLIVDQDAFRHEEQEEIKNNLRRIRELTEALAADRGPDGAAALSERGSAGHPPAPADR
jgi:voltage-gated potassium channel